MLKICDINKKIFIRTKNKTTKMTNKTNFNKRKELKKILLERKAQSSILFSTK